MSKLLMVDDNPAILQLAIDGFASEYEVITANNGEEAISLALKEFPDIIIMDFQMPVMDGIHALRILRGNPLTQTIPVIILTGLAAEEGAIMALDAGANDYITKPFNLRLLEAKIRAHLQTKAYNDNLEQVNKRLSELDRLKSHFLAMAAHELKTPLNVVNCCLEMLKESIHVPLNPGQDELLSLSLNCTADLIGLVKNMLDLSVIESGQISLELKKWDIAEAIGAVLSVMNKEAEKKALKINYPGTHVEAVFDRKWILQVLTNIISNAIKFTPPYGEIAVRVNDGEDVMTVTISDTGRGIPGEAVERVFDEFYRYDRKEEGTGLGLAICKTVVEWHGGRIWVESEIGSGSSFHFTLPKRFKNLSHKK